MALDRNHNPYASRNYVPALPVLATCKKLRNEGLPIFYKENVFDIVLFAGCDDGDTRMVLLGHEYELGQSPPVLKQIRRLNVELRGWPRRMDEDETWSDRRMLHFLCETLTESMELSQISLNVTLRYPKPLTKDNDIRENEVLTPLAFSAQGEGGSRSRGVTTIARLVPGKV